MSVPLPISAGTLPPGFCWTTPQSFLNQLAQSLTVSLPQNFTTFNYGTDVPSPDNVNMPWVRLNSDGSLDRVYVFNNGAWESPHPVAPGIATYYVDSTGDFGSDPGDSFFLTYDGGNGNTYPTPTTTAGAFWAPISAYNRFPVFAGVSGDEFFPVGELGPNANNPPGYQPNGPYNNFPNYVVTRTIYRTIRTLYQIQVT